MDSYNSPTSKPLYKGTQVVWYILYIIETLLAFRFVLKLLGANPEAGFSMFIYNITYILAAPFLNVFKVIKVSGSTFEWTTILAMFVYWILALGIIKIFLMGKTISTQEAAVGLENQGLFLNSRKSSRFTALKKILHHSGSCRSAVRPERSSIPLESS